MYTLWQLKPRNWGCDVSWIQKLHETYEHCIGHEPPGAEPLLPIAHTAQQAHVEIVIDGDGVFRRASLVQKENTVIPATEESAGRTSGAAAHPLCDKIQYCAGDYQSYGGSKKAYFKTYIEQLDTWCSSPHQHPKAKAVLAYTKKGTVVSDLVASGVLVAPKGVLIAGETSRGRNKRGNKTEESAPTIFNYLASQDQGDAFVRWRIEHDNDPCTATWEDKSLQEAWIKFESSQRTVTGLCMVTGDPQSVLAGQHPFKLRHGADKAKLISSNDTSGFTFLGRFTDAGQAAGVSYEVTQKAHSALRWLIARKQAYRNNEQVFVSWATGGQAIPDPWANSMSLFGLGDAAVDAGPTVGDAGQAYALRLKRAIAGYKANLADSADIVVMGLDSATPGRMAITFYRELKGSEFLERVERWHTMVAWHQNFGKDTKFIGAPSPRDIAETAYGRRLDEKLAKATAERLLPCIVDGHKLPRDLVDSCVRRTFNRVGLDAWEWEKCLGVACALYKGLHDERGYQMSLEEGRKTRDYLYGRLLAVAEHLEGRALYVAGEKRETMAARLMQRFADRPHSTWRTIELSLTPYKSRLRSSRAGFLWEMEQLLDGLLSSFPTGNEKESFTNDRPLSGEFLLAYHCQRQRLHEKPEPKE